MSDTAKVMRYLDEAAARVEGGGADESVPEGEDQVAHDAPVLAPRTGGLQDARDGLARAAAMQVGPRSVPPDARMRSVKMAILTATRPITGPQGVVNDELRFAIEGLATETQRVTADLQLQEQRNARLQASIATTDLTVDDLDASVRDGLDRFGTQLDALTDELRGMQRSLQELRSDVNVVRSRQDLVLRAARQALPGGYDVEALSDLTRELGSGQEELYEDLEDTFRGTRERIVEISREYVGDIESVPGSGPVIDVGCGRGEWLEVLRDESIPSYGIDTNEVVVERCVARGLDVRVGDALAHLREQPEGSVRAVTGFHLAEHLSLDTLVGLIDAALVALQPGGLLVLETPNPTNILVGSASFYLDPTHIKPLHPQFLEFLALQRGFADAEVRFLHAEDGPRLEATDLDEHDPDRTQELADRINWALFGPLDYAVLARKAGRDDLVGRDGSPSGA
jgi:SAM-dependent methyltransferase